MKSGNINPTKLLAALLAAGALSGGGQSAYAGPTIPFGDQGSLNFTYSVQAWAQTKDSDAATVRTENDFYLRRNRLTFNGQFNDYVGFYANLEGGGTPDSEDKLYFIDSYLTFDLKDELRFIVGEFKNTFARENLEACHEPLTLDRSGDLAFTPMGGSRDKGVAVWGNLMDAKLQYRVMLSKGREDAGAASENPRITARMHYSFLDPEYQYGYLGTYLGTAKVFTVGAAYDTQKEVVYADYAMRNDPKDYKAWTVDAFFEYPTEKGVVTASGAYFKYDTQDIANSTSPDPSWNSFRGDKEGYYVKAGYLLPNKVGPGRLQFFARHDAIDYGVKTGVAEYYDKKMNAVGANYYLDGQKLKLTLELAKVSFDTPHPTDTAAQDYKQATLGLQFIF